MDGMQNDPWKAVQGLENVTKELQRLGALVQASHAAPLICRPAADGEGVMSVSICGKEEVETLIAEQTHRLCAGIAPDASHEGTGTPCRKGMQSRHFPPAGMLHCCSPSDRYDAIYHTIRAFADMI